MQITQLSAVSGEVLKIFLKLTVSTADSHASRNNLGMKLAHMRKLAVKFCS